MSSKPTCKPLEYLVSDSLVTEPKQLTETQARELSAKIYQKLDDAWQLIVQAYQGRAWVALGYRTWDDWVRGEFTAVPLAMPKERREQTVRSLRDAGLSVRAIASATGEGRDTVHRIVNPEADVRYRTTPGTTPEPAAEPVLDAEVVDSDEDAWRAPKADNTTCTLDRRRASVSELASDLSRVRWMLRHVPHELDQNDRDAIRRACESTLETLNKAENKAAGI